MMHVFSAVFHNSNPKRAHFAQNEARLRVERRGLKRTLCRLVKTVREPLLHYVVRPRIKRAAGVSPAVTRECLCCAQDMFLPSGSGTLPRQRARRPRHNSASRASAPTLPNSPRE